MTTCQNCGKLNSGDANFCRFCGTKFVFEQVIRDKPQNYSPPGPYSWKTDEFQTQAEPRQMAEPRPTERVHAPTQTINPNYRPAPLAYREPQYHAHLAPGSNYAVDPNYHCPICGTSYLPVIDRRISTAGWVVFSCLLVFTIVFFWIGLLMKEDVAVCPVCRSKIN
jgi:RNA polymerase subunit RPABC4/transcription elongation factor Spt4